MKYGVNNPHQFGPAADADSPVQRRGEKDEEEECEEEGRAAHKLKEVKSAAGNATAHHFLQDERHEGQELEERGKNKSIKKNNMRNNSQCRKNNRLQFKFSHSFEEGTEENPKPDIKEKILQYSELTLFNRQREKRRSSSGTHRV